MAEEIDSSKAPVTSTETDDLLNHFHPNTLIENEVPRDFFGSASMSQQETNMFYSPQYHQENLQYLDNARTSLIVSPSRKQEFPDSEESVDEQQTVKKSAARKRKISRRKKKGDPNEPQRPVSAYALFFRDTQVAVKAQNPSASFGEVSKVVASLWDNLHPEEKSRYKKKTEMARKEYLKALAAYRANLLCTKSENNSELSCQQQEIIQIDDDDNEPPDTDPRFETGYENFHSAEHGGAELTAVMPPSHSSQEMESGYSSESFLSYPSHCFKNSNTDASQDMSCLLTPMQPLTGQCVRSGCSNPAQPNPDWEDEYCCSECVVSHCRFDYCAHI